MKCKPPLGTLNRGHRTAQQLVFAVPLFDVGKPFEYARCRWPTGYTLGSATAPTITSVGAAILCSGAGAVADEITFAPPPIIGLAEITLAAVVRRTAVVDLYEPLVGTSGTTGLDAGLQVSSGGTSYYTTLRISGADYTGTPVALAVDTDLVAFGRWRSGEALHAMTYELKTGRLIASVTSGTTRSGAISLPSGGGQIWSFGPVYDRARNFRGLIYGQFAWSRWMSDGEMAAFARDPWAMFRPDRPLIYDVRGQRRWVDR